MKKRVVAYILFALYLILLLKILVWKDLAMIRIGPIKLNFGGTQEGPANLIPFKTIFYYFTGKNGVLIAVLNIFGNIAALVPLGFLLPLVFLKIRWKQIWMIAAASGLIIESVQLLLHVGIFDVDDILLNGWGVLMGYWMYLLYIKIHTPIKSILNIVVLGGLIVISSLLTLSYYKQIELPIGIEPSVQTKLQNNLKNNTSSSSACCDLCGGTGGTGRIVAMTKDAITIKRNDSVAQIIKLTNKTIIKNNNGKAKLSDLKINNHLTVIIDETETASLILVCAEKNK